MTADLILSPIPACQQCGASDRYANGQCRPCSRARIDALRAHACRPTLERVKEALAYNPETGLFTWCIHLKNGKKHPGDIAGNLSKVNESKVYVTLALDGYRCFAHQVAWFFMTEKWPAVQVDHKDGIGTNNAFLNLREATAVENRQNLKSAQRNNRSTGLLGAYRSRSKSLPFVAMITVNKKLIHLGNFATAELAHDAYISAKREMHPYNLL